MNISLRKINAIFILKLQLFLGNLSLLMIPAMAIGYVVIFKNFFPANTVAFKELTLNMGILLNIIMGGIIFGAYPIAEEKEHHTLGVLMTSSINATEYFIGSLLPALLILTITNIILVPLNGTSWNQVSIINYLIITVICSIISILIGFTLGLFSKNQTNAGVVSLLPAAILTLVPLFKGFSNKISHTSDFLYSGVIPRFINQSLFKHSYSWSLFEVSVLIAWFIIFSIVLFYAYRYKHFD